MKDPYKAISVIQYILFCLNIVTWLIAVLVIGLCFYLRFDGDIQEWVESLEIQRFYIGLYILIISSFICMVLGFVSCIGTFSKNRRIIALNVLIQLLLFVLGLAGAAVLLDNSTFKSTIHYVIRDVMVRLINYYPSYHKASDVLLRVQEGVGCCGGNSYNDYIQLNRAIPTECRDTVTGNIYFYGCADEITWYLQGTTNWVAALVLVLCAKKVANAVLSTILVQLIIKVENSD